MNHMFTNNFNKLNINHFVDFSFSEKFIHRANSRRGEKTAKLSGQFET